MGPIQSYEDLVIFLRRRWRSIALVFLLGAAISAVFAKTRPDVFDSVAVLQIESHAPAQTGLAATPVAQRIQLIEQQLMRRDHLQATIDRHGLFADLPGLTPAERVQALRQSVRITGISGSGGFGGNAVTAVMISVRLGDPFVAAEIANEFAQSLITASAEDEAARIAAARDFFRTEAARLAAAMSAVEAEAAAYKSANLTALPERRTALLTELTGLQGSLAALDGTRAALDSERLALSAQTPLRETARRRLDQIAGELAAIDSQRAALDGRRAELAATLDAMPQVEAVLAGYDRQIAQLQAELTAASQRLAEAEAEQRLAEARPRDSVTLLEAAVPADYPSGSSGKKLAVMGAALSLMAALGLAFAREAWPPVLRTSAQMERQLGLRPLVAIPERQPPNRKQLRLRMRRL